MPASELCEKMRELPEPPSDSHPPLWDFWRHDLWQRVVSGEDPEKFFDWPCIYHTMLTRHWRDANDIEYQRIMPDPRFVHAVITPGFAGPPDYYEYPYSGNLIHQAHHIYQFQKQTGLEVRDMKMIFEFGGGYGAMALVCHRLGFRGKYVIMDLPEFALLQQYYLSNLEIKNVSWATSADLGRLPDLDMFIACYSLSEVDFGLRQELLRRVHADSYLFLYTHRFANYINTEFFMNDMPAAMNHIDWYTVRADHLPDGNYYAFGKRQLNGYELYF